MTLDQLLNEAHTALVDIKQNDLVNIKQASDWQSKYRILMHVGKKLPFLPEKMKQSELLIKGCEARAWLLHYHDKTDDKHYFLIDSDARIVKGLMAVMLALINGTSSTELGKLNLEHAFDELNLKPYLSQSRGNGLNAMISRIKSVSKN